MRVDDSAERQLEEARLAEMKAREGRLKERRVRDQQEMSAFDRVFARRAGEMRTNAEKQTLAHHSADQKQYEQSGRDQIKTRERAWAAESLVQPRALGEQRIKEANHEYRQENEAYEQRLNSSTSTSSNGGRGIESSTEKSSDSKGNSQGDKSGSDDSKKEQEPAPFRLPPAALMEPPPIARPRNSGASMASATKEIIDKIVSRVMVGTNSQGFAEFRLELKSSVLKGLSIRISRKQKGKICAVFSGHDREVLSALKKSSSQLVQGLSAKGLEVEDLVFENT